jgi:hypothetical protein
MCPVLERGVSCACDTICRLTNSFSASGIVLLDLIALIGNRLSCVNECPLVDLQYNLE